MPPQSELQPSPELLAAAMEMLGEEATVREWLQRPKDVFEGLSPLEFANTRPDGERRVLQWIWGAIEVVYD